MTSSATSTDRERARANAAARARRQRALIALGVAAVALVAGAGFILWHHRFRLTAPAIVLILGWASVLATVYFLWRTADNADLDDQEDWWKPTGRREELIREKKSLLKAIKETELDRDTGKLSPEDADEIIRRYRARAIDVIKAIDGLDAGGAEGGDVRARIEREVRARLEVDRAGKRRDGAEAPAAAPAASAEPAAPAASVEELLEVARAAAAGDGVDADPPKSKPEAPPGPPGAEETA